MSKAKNGDTVKVYYTGRLDDNTIFDSSSAEDPLEFKLGDGTVMSAFEEVIVGMEAGDEKTITIPPDRAYGLVNQEYIFDISRSKLPQGVKPMIGDNLELRQADDSKVIVKVLDVSEKRIKIDANHPLAGKQLIFEIRLVSIN